jgi:subtilisin family serine protease
MLSKVKYLRILALIAVLALVIGTVRSSFAQDDPNGPTGPADYAARVQNATVGSRNILNPNATGMVTLLVQYQGKPAAQAYADVITNGGSESAAINASQSAVESNNAEQIKAQAKLAAMGAREVYRLQRILNASVIRVDASKVEAIKSLPGVTKVTYAPRHTIDNSSSVPFINGNVVWDSTGALSTLGLTGDGITIAVIDTGVDYLHANFNGDTSDYASQNPDVINSDGVAFPTARVIAGWDFVGDDYAAETDNPWQYTPFPDPDPTDCNGHGSHVAGTAAGNGILTGAAYTGPYDDLDAVDLAAFDIGPGVAPEASIVAFKVFGCEGSTDVVLQAIEKATDPNGDGNPSDHYDVINMSLGSSYGDGSEYEAIENASLAGLIVVTSSGNSSDAHYITGSPGSAPNAISTAASNDDGIVAWKLDTDLDGGGIDISYVAIDQGWSPTPGTDPFPATLTALEEPSGDSLGCAAADFAGFTGGNIALVERGTCSIKLKAYNAQLAGASAAVIWSATLNVPNAASDDNTVPAVTIPTVMISGDAGLDILDDMPGATAQIAISGGPNLMDQIAGFSSRGPRRGNITGSIGLKPDITAPGVDIVSTGTGYTTGTGYDPASLGGTSMASPHMAGVMALMRQLHPNYTVAQLKALVMNTANHDIYDMDLISGAAEDVVSTARMGAGRVDVVNATDANLIAYSKDRPEEVSVTFQTRDVLNGDFVTEQHVVVIENKGSGSVTFTPSIYTVTDAPGISFDVNTNPITVGAGKKKEIIVFADYDSVNMIHTIGFDSFDVQTGNQYPRHWITEETGYLYLTASGASTTDLRVPLYAAPRPASDMSASTGTMYLGATTGSDVVLLTGQDVENWDGSGTYQSNFIQRYRSRVSMFNLAYTDGVDSGTSGDIKYVGVNSDYWYAGLTSFFGIAYQHPTDTPASRITYVCMDLDQDGEGGDFEDGTDVCFVTSTQDSTDVHTTDLCDISGTMIGSGQCFLGWDFQNGVLNNNFDTRLMDSDVQIIPGETDPALYAFLDSIPGIGPVWTSGSDADPAFDYYIYTFDFDYPVAGVSDATPKMTFDPVTAPIVHDEAASTYYGAAAPINRDSSADDNGGFEFSYDLTATGSAEMLLLHHYNFNGNRAEVVTLSEDSAPTLDCGIILNCDMETDSEPNGTPDNWVEKGTLVTDELSSGTGYLGSTSFMFDGGSTNSRKLRQENTSGGSAGDQYQLTARVDRTLAPSSAKVQIKVTIYNTDGTKQKILISVPNGTDMSTLLDSGVVTVLKNYSKIRVDVLVKTSSGTVYADNVSLVQIP